MTATSTIALRIATADDDRAVNELAQLDSRRPPAQPTVLALVDGRPVAAASLQDGSVVADPFVETADVVALLQARVAADAVRSGRTVARRRRVPRVPRLPRLRAA